MILKNTFRKISILPYSVFIFLSLFSTPTYSQNTEKNNMETKAVISKNATLEELGTIKKNLEAKGFGFQHSNVVYNDNGEIVAITIEYTDANNNSGKYSVSSEKPINSIVIVSDGNRISVKNEGSGNQAFISQGNGKQIEKDSEDRKMAMEERRKQMEKEMEQRQNEMKIRREQMRKRMEQQRNSSINAAQSNNNSISDGNFNIISKNTTDEELLELKKSYAVQNISLSFTDLKRNETGEITHISITADNGQGSVSTSNFGNGNLPIKSIQVMVNETHTILRNME